MEYKGIKGPVEVFRPQEFCEKTRGVVFIQESKMEVLDTAFVKSLWSSKEIGWDFVASTNLSGELMTLWDMSKIISNN